MHDHGHLNNYLFVRINDIYYGTNTCIVNVATDIYEKDFLYTVNEFIRGSLPLIFKINRVGVEETLKLLRSEFHDLGLVHDVSKEFYNRKIIELIEPFLKKNSIDYIQLTEAEIEKIYASTKQKLIERETKIKDKSTN